MRERVPTFQTSKKRTPKVGGFAAHFACGFFDFWRGGARSRIVFLEVLARRPLSLSDDNTKKTQKISFRHRPQTDFIRLVSLKLVLQGDSRRPGRLF